ncbi:MAG: flagellar export chaperone FliS [Phycisphaerales bacterium]|nr:flagellar export chaperone FliS [Phycisphaerae bacterium]NNF44461.1 flagellar export chaperone FliS [Phycisphaerales bacterium]NNM26976.1 flagellar export chaperone FliS [Phycisphaerales bacterium]
MSTSGVNPYLRTKVLTASPAELRLMLFDGAIKFLEQGRQGIEERNYEQMFNGISKCQNILVELMNGLVPKHAPELCEKLSALYTFMYTQLIKACSERDVEVLEEVLKLLRYERETWAMLMSRLTDEGTEAEVETNDGSVSVSG